MITSLKSLLLIEDRPDEALFITRRLRSAITEMHGIQPEIVWVDSLTQAFGVAKAARFDACLLDLCLGNHEWQATVSGIPALSALCPVVCMTAFLDAQEACRVTLAAGAQDFISKERLHRYPEHGVEMLCKAVLRAGAANP